MDAILKQNIIHDLGIDALSEEEQEKALLAVGNIIFQAVLIRVADELNEEEKNELEKLFDEAKEDDESVLRFLQSKIPNLEEIINEEVAKFKQASVDFMKAVGKK